MWNGRWGRIWILRGMGGVDEELGMALGYLMTTAFAFEGGLDWLE